jgi:hypothetical protein
MRVVLVNAEWVLGLHDLRYTGICIALLEHSAAYPPCLHPRRRARRPPANPPLSLTPRRSRCHGYHATSIAAESRANYRSGCVPDVPLRLCYLHAFKQQNTDEPPGLAEYGCGAGSGARRFVEGVVNHSQDMVATNTGESVEYIQLLVALPHWATALSQRGNAEGTTIPSTPPRDQPPLASPLLPLSTQC